MLYQSRYIKHFRLQSVRRLDTARTRPPRLEIVNEVCCRFVLQLDYERTAPLERVEFTQPTSFRCGEVDVVTLVVPRELRAHLVSEGAAPFDCLVQDRPLRHHITLDGIPL